MKSQAYKMKETVKACLGLFVNIIKDIRDDKLTSVNVSDVEIVQALLQAYNGNDLLEEFIEQHKNWIEIKNRNEAFIKETLPIIYSNVGFDVGIFAVPFDVLKTLKEEGLNGEFDEDDWPLCEDDIDTIWQYFETMVSIACNHIHLKRGSNSKNNPGANLENNPGANLEHYPGINLEHYVTLFGVKLIETP